MIALSTRHLFVESGKFHADSLKSFPLKTSWTGPASKPWGVIVTLHSGTNITGLSFFTLIRKFIQYIY